ncbi:hypothetical protein V8E54_007155 [Elaphomyces granulatus]
MKTAVSPFFLWSSVSLHSPFLPTLPTSAQSLHSPILQNDDKNYCSYGITSAARHGTEIKDSDQVGSYFFYANAKFLLLPICLQPCSFFEITAPTESLSAGHGRHQSNHHRGTEVKDSDLFRSYFVYSNAYLGTLAPAHHNQPKALSFTWRPLAPALTTTTLSTASAPLYQIQPFQILTKKHFTYTIARPGLSLNRAPSSMYIIGLFILIRTGVSEERSWIYACTDLQLRSINQTRTIREAKQGLDSIDSIKSSKMPRTRSSASLAASKATGKQAKTTAKKGQKNSRTAHQVDIAEKRKGR